MASSKKSKAFATFQHPMTFEVRKAKFEPLASVAMLDLARLSKGSHTIEIGFAEGGCCRRAVSAVIKNGIVTGVEIADCKDSKKPVDKETLAIVQAARRKLGQESGEWEPVPVAVFFQSQGPLEKITVRWGGWCIMVCVKWGGVNYCLYCCLWFPRCGIPDIYTGPLN